MGWWSPDILGGDQPYDVRADFEDTFGSTDPQFNIDRIEDDEEPIEFRIPTADEGLDYLLNHSNDEVDSQVIGWMLIERGAPLHDRTREIVLNGIELELEEGCETWKDPQERIIILEAFKQVVEGYAAEGEKIELPHQRGLFEMLATHLNS